MLKSCLLPVALMTNSGFVLLQYMYEMHVVKPEFALYRKGVYSYACSCEKQARSEFFAMVPSAAPSLLSDRHCM